MNPSRREVLARLAGLSALPFYAAALAGCGRERSAEPAFGGRTVGAGFALGHRLLTGELLDRPVSRREEVEVAILGAGPSGLAAAWRLFRKGVRDISIFELEGAPGGTAVSGENAISRYPWGAHYLPVPVERDELLEALLEEAGALVGRDASGVPEWAEEVLCREPEERLFYRGLWWEGLYPRAGASAAEVAERDRFDAEMRGFAALRDGKGRRAFALPSRLSSDDADLLALDRIPFSEWLDARGYRGTRLRWVLEYGTRDDFGSSLEQVSAWAGIHYYAARLAGGRAVRSPVGAEPQVEEAAPFLTWPEGNGRLVETLLRPVASRLRTGHLAFDVLPGDGAAPARVRLLDAAKDEVVEVAARHVVFALPKHTARFILAPWRASRPAFLTAFDEAPWLVANLTLSGRPREERGFPLAWDNVIHDSPGLGYVVATHQSLVDRGPTVISYYRPFAGEPSAEARKALFGATWKELAEAAVADLSRAHPDLPGLVTNVDVMRWGHAMARPAPGFVWGEARRAAAAPLGNVLFAHADVAGLPLFEEAFDAGTRAAGEILRASA